MSQQVTEVVKIPLAKGVDLSSGENQKIWNEALKTIALQPGNISVYWGVRVEDPEIAHMVIGLYPNIRSTTSRYHRRSDMT
jgi:hypothetical protein